MATNNGRPRITDFSNLAPDREEFKLPDGNIYEMVSSLDLGPVFAARFGKLATDIEAVREDATQNVESAMRMEELTREQAALLVPGMPEELARSLPFQLATGIVARFILSTGSGLAGMVPQIQELVDQLQTPDGTS